MQCKHLFVKVHTHLMDQYDGTLTPDLRSATFTTNNVTVRITAGGDATLKLSPEQVRQLVKRIQRALMEQAQRDEPGDSENPAPEA